MNDERLITLAHGNGGRRMRDLIRDVFVRHLGNGALDANADAARLLLPAGEIIITTDGFSVQPLEFPGGDIGSLAVHGTINDLAVAGALPVHLSLGVFIEVGFEFARLDRLVASLGRTARACGVSVVAGDTKVLPRGHGGGLYLTTTGIGVRTQGLQLGLDAISPGDLILVSGPVGDHGTAVLLAREEFGLRSDLASDAASVLPLTQALVDLPGLRFMRDPTRGGLATVAHEIAVSRSLSLRLREADIPLRDPVRSVCEMLGYDPLYLACEGRVVAAVARADAAAALARWRALPQGAEAQIIGEVAAGPPQVVLETELGGERIIEELEDEPLPRIC